MQSTPHRHAAAGSVCIACGCTDSCACPAGCFWVKVQGAVGVCSSCNHAVDAWRTGNRLATAMPAQASPSELRVLLDGVPLEPAQPGLPQGLYFAVNTEARTVFVVDQDGEPPAVPVTTRLQVEFAAAAIAA